jgi:hypothetical protein
VGHRRVAQGDTLPSIAALEGHADWRAIWDHPENAELKRRRQSPHVLAPGDVVFIPEKEQRDEQVASGQRHRFVVKNATMPLKLVLKDRRGEPLANKAFELVAGGVTRTGTTDGNGKLEVKVPTSAREGTLKIKDPDVTFPIAIGHLDPVDEESGVRQRLRNLGYLPHERPSARIVEDAIRRFQVENDLSETGTADEATRTKLREEHKV